MRLFIAILLYCSSANASALFWDDANENKQKKWNNKTIEIEGSLSYFKKYIRARDNFYILRVKDPDSAKYIEVKLYTIKNLKRVNYFRCKEGNSVRIKGKLFTKNKKNQIGLIRIDKKAKKFECSQKVEGMNNE